jgi:asparagine N-glycosylation enzyme membrane subunit Stt3
MKRAHLHSQTMGVISIAFSLLVAWLSFPARAQMGISLLSGLGSLGYGVFWMSAGFLAPGMGSTGAAKESIALIAQASGAAFFIAGVSLFGFLTYRMFVKLETE